MKKSQTNSTLKNHNMIDLSLLTPLDCGLFLSKLRANSDSYGIKSLTV
ncbi:protein of unknown function [Xenorhabdus poinarii G6]|uniref:Uncharacterized protein n=1 Tax=Xenorhabdus poinarii G6 TaxID=1354304 RepID=A0A068R260_9GAMM|nr:protein of unknown function [Xenorhabdus poinarii G6]